MKYLHSDITGKIIGACFRVHSFLGNGFQEVIYQRALEHEFNELKMPYQREIEKEIFYRDVRQAIGKRRADFVVMDKVLVELKARSSLDSVHKSQVLNYLKAYQLDIGLLINFGTESLQIERLASPRLLKTGNENESVQSGNQVNQ